MDNRSKIKRIRETLNEIESSITGKGERGDAEGKIRSAADKGRDIIGMAEDKAVKVADKAGEVKRKYREMDEDKKKGLWALIGAAAAAVIALIGINKIKRITNKRKDYEEQ